MYKLPNKVENLVPYQPISGNYKIRLDANESFYRLADDEIAEIISGVQLNRYPDPLANDVVEVFARLYDTQPEHVTAGNGSDELISIITACLLEKGDRILTFSPDFSMYAFYPSLYELEVLDQSKTDDLEIDIDLAIRNIREHNIKAVLFSNPCNPTSIGMPIEQVKRLVSETDALIIVDEAYMDFWDTAESMVTFAHEHDNVIVLKTCSKAIALAGIRLGFAVANETLTNALRAVKSPYNVSSLSQAIGHYVLSDKIKIANMSINLSKLAKGLRRQLEAACPKGVIRLFDTTTNFVFMETLNEEIADDIFRYLLKKGIVIRKMGKYLRITTGKPEENAELLAAWKEYGDSV